MVRRFIGAASLTETFTFISGAVTTLYSNNEEEPMSIKRSPAKKTVAAKASRRSAPRRLSNGSFVAVRIRESAPDWKENLEMNLIAEGISPAKARGLVKLAAS